MRLTVFLILPILTVPLFDQTCFDKLNWTTSEGQIFVNGFPLLLKGVNYFGFETESYAPHGLWLHDLDFYLDFIKQNDFNAIRVPFSLDMVWNDPEPNLNCTTREQLLLCGKSAMELLDVFIDRAAQRGLLIILDNHCITPAGEGQMYEQWKTILERWNLFAIDIKNEPHDRARWGNSSWDFDWNRAAERLISNLELRFSGLFFVEGIEWGTSFEGALSFPIDTSFGRIFKRDDRVVYSPHAFGPSVHELPEFQDPDFPNNLHSFYNTKFGFLRNHTGNPVVMGAWGGRFYPGTSDEKWNNWFVDWMIANRLTNNFYWCLNPNAGDTGGLLEDDWTTPVTRKLKLLKRLQPHPTKFEAREEQVCITPGIEGRDAIAN